MQGTPPSYVQFASYWQCEYQARQTTKVALKPEWAYLNFLDRYAKDHPTASKSQAIAAWKIEREIYIAKVKTIMKLNDL